MRAPNRIALRLLLTGLMITSGAALAGEIAGLRSNAPPFLDAPLEFSFSNDFLGRGGRTDDFRTQQFIIAGTIADRWELVVDHSILTLVDGDVPGRTDQLSATLGYRMFDTHSGSTANRLTAGFGLRGYGDFAGERIQNGFHQLVRSGTEEVPYTDLDRTDGVAWLDGHRYAVLRHSGAWRWGYWLRGSALYTSDSQFDAALGAYAVGRRGTVDFWLGLRQDWRAGYDEPVLRETADAEEALAAVIGVKWGPFVFETVQQFDGPGSYGQLRLLASGFDSSRAGSARSRFELDADVTIPDVYANLTGRWRAAWLERMGGAWQPSLYVTAGYGEPQLDRDPQIYLRAIQAGVGIEWERPLAVADGRARFYASLGAGWRRENVFGDGDREGEKSDTLSTATALGGFGIRIDAAELFWNYNLGIRLGVTAWVPFSDGRVDMADESFRVFKPTAAIVLGLTLGRFEID